MTAQRVASARRIWNIGINCLIPNYGKDCCDLPGVGAKIAKLRDAVCLRADQGLPIDVWIERILREQYFNPKSKVTAKTLAEFAAKYFGGHGGYAQQYLFHYARKIKARAKGVRKIPRFARDDAAGTDGHTEHEGQVAAARFVRGDRCDILSPEA